jgi:hypothetical protein
MRRCSFALSPTLWGYPQNFHYLNYRRKNVTGHKKTTAAIENKLNGFSNPQFPRDFLIKNHVFFQLQAQILKEDIGIDAMARWGGLGV